MKKRQLRYLMDIADLTAAMSRCKRLQVGAVLASVDLTQFVVGYNGGVKGGPNTCLREDEGACGCVHAEMNAIAKATAGVHRVAILTVSPCELCATLLANAGVTHVYYHYLYRESLRGIEALDRGGVVRFTWEEVL